MKKNKIIITGSIIILAVFIFACSKNEIQDTDRIQEITGTYVGYYSNASLSVTHDSTAQADIAKAGDGEISVHCYGEALDTTFMLNYYEQNDSVMVCLTGQEFENMYGHTLGNGHTMGGMMGDRPNNETEWMHHLNDEHKEGDKHYGLFDMNHNSFDFIFYMGNGDSNSQIGFHGIKK